ncbi:MAG: hypothetical protein ACRC7O_15355, partial [Fimbriiglobus sp.]
MANARFNVTCPSCEGDVPVRSSSAVGTKIECPKCKYRFTCPPDTGESAADGDTAVATADPAIAPKPKKKANPTVMIGTVLGVVAVAVLVGGALFLFGDEEPNKPVAKAPITPRPVEPVEPIPEEPDPTKPVELVDPMKPIDPDPTKPVGPMPTEPPEPAKPIDPSLGPPIKPAVKPVVPKVDPTIPISDPTAVGTPSKTVKIPPRPRTGTLSDPTNLLPNDVASVVRVNIADAARTPFYGALFDNPTRDLFTNSMSFAPDDMLVLLHATVGPDREPFAVIRTKVPLDAQTLFERNAAVAARGSPVRTRHYFLVRTNPLMRAVGGALSAEAMLPVLGIPAVGRPAAGNKPLAVHVYDDQTLLVSTEASLFRFLSDLQPNGYPKYLTDLVADVAPAAPGDPAAPGPPMPPAGTPPAAPPPPVPPTTPEDPAARKLFTTVPSFRTIDPNLKRTLNALEIDVRTPPAVIYAEVVNQKSPIALAVGQSVSRLAAPFATGGAVLAANGLNPLSPQAAAATLVAPLRIIGASLTAFARDRMITFLTLEYAGVDEAKAAMNERVMPLVTAAAPYLGYAFGTTLAVGNQVPLPPVLSPPGETGGPTSFGDTGGPNRPPGGPPNLPRNPGTPATPAAPIVL